MPSSGGAYGRGFHRERDAALPLAWLGLSSHYRQISRGYGGGIETYPIEVKSDGVYVGLKKEEAHAQTISDAMLETCVNWGIKHIFGMIGHSCLGLAEAVRKQEEAGNLKFFTVRHEGAAAFAASGYAKLTGQPAACLTIAGPGATNLMTGLWDAKVDRVPLLAMTGQVNTQVLGPGSFQEVDLSAAFSAVADFSQTVLHNSKHSELMTLALKRAKLNRDVAHLIFPDEVQVLARGEQKASSPQGRITSQKISPPQAEMAKAIEQIKNSRRPILICGHGARFHRDQIISFAESMNIPVLTTFKGKGIIPDTHPLGCGVLGRSGTPIASWFMNESDLMIVLGASFADHTGITSKKPTIQIDFDPIALGKVHSIDTLLWGEVGVTLDILNNELKGKTNTIDHRREISKRWAIWRAEKQKREQEDRAKGINSASIFAAMIDIFQRTRSYLLMLATIPILSGVTLNVKINQ